MSNSICDKENMNSSTAKLVEPFASFVHRISRNTKHETRSPQTFSPRKTPSTSRKHLHPLAKLLKMCQHMSVSLCARNMACCLAAICLAPAAFGQAASYALQGGEYKIGGAMAGDQVRSHLAMKSSGGYRVWQDNRTDGDGLGISALRLD